MSNIPEVNIHVTAPQKINTIYQEIPKKLQILAGCCWVIQCIPPPPAKISNALI